MIRTLIPPVAAAVLLAGCVTTADYRYYQGRGDYYYGQPVIEYREQYYGYPWGFYGYYGYPRAGWHLGFHYGHPYYGYPYYWYPYPHPHVHRRPVRPTEPTVDPTPDRPRSPWRDLEHLRRRSEMRDDAARTTTGDTRAEDTQAPWRVVGPRVRAPEDTPAPRRPPVPDIGPQPRPVEPAAPPPRIEPRWRDEDRAPEPVLRRVRERDDDHTP